MPTVTATNLTIDRGVLQAALAIVGPAVPAKPTKEILRHVLLKYDGEAMTLAATDLELSVTHTLLGTSTDQPFRVLLPHFRMVQILNATKESEIAIQVDDDRLDIIGQGFQFKLPSERPDDYPEPTGADFADCLVMKQEFLKRAIRHTAYCTDQESTRYALGGVLVAESEGKRALVATDGRRLSLQPIESEEQGSVFDSQPVIPTKVLKVLNRILDEDEVRIQWNANQVYFDLGSTVVSSRLVEGRFPRWQDVLPGAAVTRISGNAGAFLCAAEQASIVSSDESRGVLFKFSERGLQLTGQTADVGESKIDLYLTVEGPSVDITFDARYVVEYLKSVDGDEDVAIDLIDEKNPALFRVGEYRHLIVPLTAK